MWKRPARTGHALHLVRGYTLIELMAAFAIAALLAAIALPSFQEPLRKSRRAHAIVRLQQLQQAQERHRADHARYAGDLAALGLPATTADGLYTLAIRSAGEIGYTATASVIPGSAQAGDQRCSILRLTQAGAQTSFGSLDANGVEDAGARSVCWNR
jgi:type IV pilus assembly protein PilE